MSSKIYDEVPTPCIHDPLGALRCRICNPPRTITHLAPTEARKNDVGKLRYDLLPPDAMDELVFVYTVGALKYDDRNWEKGMKWGRFVAAMERHIAAWKSGEMLDSEDGQHHLASVAWCALALITYELRGIGEDDRGAKVKLPRRKVSYVH